MFGQPTDEPVGEPALQLRRAAETALRRQLGRPGAFHPLDARALVAADVDVPAREDVEDLLPEVEDHRECRILEIQHLVEDAERGGRLVPGLRVVAELGVRGQQGRHVSGELDLGHDRDATVRGVPDQGAELVLAVEPAVRRTVSGCLGGSAGLAPPAGDLGESRIALRLEPPALVVGQMQVEGVELVQGEQVDEPVHIAERHEVPAGVQVHPAPAEAWPVLDPDTGHDERADSAAGQQGGRGQQLAKGLDGPVDRGGIGRVDGDRVLVDHQPVALGAQRVVPPDPDPAVRGIRQLQAGARGQQPTDDRRELGGTGDGVVVGEDELSGQELDGRRSGQQHRDTLVRACRYVFS